MHSFTLIRIRTAILLLVGFFLVTGRTLAGDNLWLAPVWQAALIGLITFTALTSESVTVVWVSLGTGLSLDALTGHPMGVCALACMGSAMLVRRFRPYISADQYSTQVLTSYFVSFSMHTISFVALKLIADPAPVWISYSGYLFLWTAVHQIWISPILFKGASGWDLKMWKRWRQVSAFRDNQQIKQRPTSSRFG